MEAIAFRFGSALNMILNPSSDALRPSRVLSAVRFFVFFVAIGAVLSPPLANLSAVCALCLFFALPDLRPRLKLLRSQPMVKSLGLLVLVVLGSAGYALSEGVPSQVVGRGLLDWRQLLLLPVVVAVFAEPSSRRVFVFLFVGFAGAVTLAIIMALYLGLSRDLVRHSPGVLLSNNVTQSLLLAIGGFLALFAARCLVSGRRKLHLALVVVGLGVLVTLIVSQNGRSGILALIVMLTTVSLMRSQGWARLGAGLCVAVLLGALISLVPLQRDRFGQALRELGRPDQVTEVSSMGVRIKIWHDTLNMVWEKPLMGWGLGSYGIGHASYRDSNRDALMTQANTDPHNQFLQIWVEMGLPGLAAFAALVWGSFRQMGPRGYREIGIAVLAAWLVNSLFSSHFWVFSEGHLILVLMGIFLARDPATVRPPGFGDRMAC